MPSESLADIPFNKAVLSTPVRALTMFSLYICNFFRCSSKGEKAPPTPLWVALLPDLKILTPPLATSGFGSSGFGLCPYTPNYLSASFEGVFEDVYKEISEADTHFCT